MLLQRLGSVSGRRAACPTPPAHLPAAVVHHPPARQVASLWEELHTRQPWRNALGDGKPIQPFPQQQQEAQAAAGAANSTQQQQVRRKQARTHARAAIWLSRPIMHPLHASGAPCCSVACRSSSVNDPNDPAAPATHRLQHLVAYIGINTGLTSRTRRDILRRTWVPSGGLDAIEQQHGVRVRFFAGRSQQPGDKVETDLAAEAKEVGARRGGLGGGRGQASGSGKEAPRGVGAGLRWRQAAHPPTDTLLTPLCLAAGGCGRMHPAVPPLLTCQSSQPCSGLGSTPIPVAIRGHMGAARCWTCTKRCPTSAHI